MMDESVNKRFEGLFIPCRKMSGRDQVDYCFQLTIVFIEITCPITFGFEIVYLLR